MCVWDGGCNWHMNGTKGVCVRFPHKHAVASECHCCQDHGCMHWLVLCGLIPNTKIKTVQA